MTVAVSRAKGAGAEAIICASTGNTAASCAAYAARAGLRGAVIVPEGRIAIGKLAQALMHGARVIALRGNFDQALEIVRELAERHPVELVNSVNPYRIEGQKTAAFEVCDELGGPPDALAIPVGNAGNITAWWRGFQEYEARPGPVRLPGRGRGAAGPRQAGGRAARRSPRRSGSATRRAGRRRWRRSPPRAAGSPPSPTSRSSTPTTCWPRARGSSASRRRPPPWPGSWPTGCPRPRAASRPRRSSACSPATGSRTPTRRWARRPPVIGCEAEVAAVERAVFD